MIVSLNFKEKEFEIFTDPTVFAQYPEWTFLKQSILSHCFLGDVECSLNTFLRVFAEIPGLFAQIRKLVMSSDFFPKKRKRCSENTECSSQKKGVLLSRIK